jgi:D-threo-aldose 1-dehydrogenase
MHFGPLAIGTAPLGGLYAPVDDDGALETLERAAAAGITHFDTAPHYGRGLAETRLGAFLATRPSDDPITVSTKVGRSVRATARRAPDDLFVGAPPGESVHEFSPRAIDRQLAESRARLGREHLDAVFVHDPDDHLDDALVTLEHLRTLQAAGDIDAVGVGTNSPAVVTHLLDRVQLDVVLLAGRITLLDRSGDQVAARCAAEDVSLVAAGVFQSGILAGDAAATIDYRPADAAGRARVAALAAVCAAHHTDLHTAASTHPRRIVGVTSTLIGVRSAAEVTAAVAAWQTDLPFDAWDAIDRVRGEFP